ncbi:hypothetical protein SH1V18_36490 [Vallitalea longa]|uniref:Uncharacterized protein n=1 Tax=Vallitalea longa TaxID=2936439 RepID=A0A9W5YDQ6_9FIRM|nr:hypothetical protein [Vallitalea longa]GKX31169.1 hypothetical protein SH1V18_36490 [Vallitalea longa]
MKLPQIEVVCKFPEGEEKEGIQRINDALCKFYADELFKVVKKNYPQDQWCDALDYIHDRLEKQFIDEGLITK